MTTGKEEAFLRLEHLPFLSKSIHVVKACDSITAHFGTILESTHESFGFLVTILCSIRQVKVDPEDKVTEEDAESVSKSNNNRFTEGASLSFNNLHILKRGDDNVLSVIHLNIKDMLLVIDLSVRDLEQICHFGWKSSLTDTVEHVRSVARNLQHVTANLDSSICVQSKV